MKKRNLLALTGVLALFLVKTVHAYWTQEIVLDTRVSVVYPVEIFIPEEETHSEEESTQTDEERGAPATKENPGAADGTVKKQSDANWESKNPAEHTVSDTKSPTNTESVENSSQIPTISSDSSSVEQSKMVEKAEDISKSDDTKGADSGSTPEQTQAPEAQGE